MAPDLNRKFLYRSFIWVIWIKNKFASKNLLLWILHKKNPRHPLNRRKQELMQILFSRLHRNFCKQIGWGEKMKFHVRAYDLFRTVAYRVRWIQFSKSSSVFSCLFLFYCCCCCSRCKDAHQMKFHTNTTWEKEEEEKSAHIVKCVRQMCLFFNLASIAHKTKKIYIY